MATHTLTDANAKTTVLGSDAALTGWTGVLPGSSHLATFFSGGTADAAAKKAIIAECSCDYRLNFIRNSMADMVAPITVS